MLFLWMVGLFGTLRRVPGNLIMVESWMGYIRRPRKVALVRGSDTKWNVRRGRGFI